MIVKTIAPHSLKLHDLKTRFNLKKAETTDFFVEWRDRSVVLTEADHGVLDRLKRNYLYLLEYPVMESIVKMVVLSPILDLAGFYKPPIRVEGEASIQVIILHYQSDSSNPGVYAGESSGRSSLLWAGGEWK
jgi:hypothetical protein